MMSQWVLLPGLLCDEAVWEGIDNISSQTDSLIPDYGGLDSIETMAAFVLEKAPKTFVLIGHSMGGRVALEVYRQAPERITHLVLMDTGYQPRAEGEAGQKEKQGRFTLLEKAKTQGMREMGKTWLAGMVHPDRLGDPVLIESILQMIERKTPDIFAAQIHALLSRPDATSVLKNISCPTLLVCGREDEWSPLDRHQDMLAVIPNSELCVIEHSGHMSTMEQPKAVASTIQSWLEKQI